VLQYLCDAGANVNLQDKVCLAYTAS